ncbi:putative invertase inhibitor [Carex littledalei]|uniref:Putative invertase inhibitor n=1 Tax=Carex littledalei TaxID=544730 RepID=A0A833VHY5_9POAL|nr:putative invertase inhibitor [Carex littledalei]
MKFRSSSVVILILALFVSLPHFNKASFLFYACSRAAAYDLNINRDFCLTSLQADPKSVSANLTGLLHISINLAIKNTTRTISHIRYLLSNSAYAHLKDDLSFCQDQYSEAIGCLYGAIKQVRLSSNDDHTNVNWIITEAMTSVDACEDESNKSILSKENGNTFELCAIALTFLNNFRKL